MVIVTFNYADTLILKCCLLEGCKNDCVVQSLISHYFTVRTKLNVEIEKKLGHAETM